MKKGRRTVSIAIILTMLLSMFTAVHADGESVPETVVYRSFLGHTGLPNTGLLGDNNDSYHLWRLLDGNSNPKIYGGDWDNDVRALPLTEEEAMDYADNDKYGAHFSIKKASYGNVNLFLNAITEHNADAQPLPMFAWDTARVEIDVWSTSADSANYPVGMGMKLLANGAESWPSINASHNWEARKWNRYSIPLKSLVTTKYSEAKGLWFRLIMPATVTEDFEIYFRNFRVVYDPGVNVDIAASASGKKVTLSTFERYGDIAADSFDIYRNGKLIAENFTGTAFTDDVVPNNEYIYTVKAKSNGAVTASVDKFITPARAAKNAQVYIDAGGPTGNVIPGNNTPYDGGNGWQLGIRGDESDSSAKITGDAKLWEKFSAHITDLTVVEKEKYGNDSGVFLDIPANSLPSGAAFRVSINRTKGGAATDDFTKLPSEYWESAYVTFEVWDSVGTNYPTAVKLPISAREGEDGAVTDCGDYTVPITSEFAARKWNHVGIPLSSLIAKHTYAQLQNRLIIQFGGHNRDNDASKMFIRNLKICYAPGVSVDTSVSLDKVTLTFGPYDVTPDSYNIYRDGALIAENVAGTATSYTDTVPESGCSYTYTVAAVSGGEELAEGKAEATVYPLNRKKSDKMLTFLDSKGNSNFEKLAFTWDIAAPSKSGLAPQNGGYSWKWYYNTKSDLVNPQALVQQYYAKDGQTIEKKDMLEFMIYTDAKNKDNLPTGIKLYYNDGLGDNGGMFNLRDYIKLGEWSYVRIPAKKFDVSTDRNNRPINRIEIIGGKLDGNAEPFNVYIANMGISQANLSVDAYTEGDKIIVEGSSTVEGDTYKLFKSGADTPVLTCAESDFNDSFPFEDEITEYNTDIKYTLNCYDGEGKLVTSAETTVRAAAPENGIILAVKDGKRISECAAGDTVTVRAYPGGNAADYVVMAAVYAADGSLVSAQRAADGVFTPNAAGTVKLMLFDGLTKLTPLAAAKTLTVK